MILQTTSKNERIIKQTEINIPKVHEINLTSGQQSQKD